MFAPKRRADKVKRTRLRSLELEPLALMAELASLLGGASALGAHGRKGQEIAGYRAC